MQKSKVKSKSYSKESSFTLLELLIVIAIIAILAAVVLIALNDAKQSAWEARGLQFSQNIKSTLGADLVGEWSFDDSANPGRDDSGNGNNGTVYDVTWTQNGKVRGAVDFNGNGSYIEPSKNISIGLSGFTISFWINIKNNPPENKYSGGIIGQGTTNGVQIYLSSYRNPAVRVWNGTDYNWAHSANTSLETDNNWYHVAYAAKRNEFGTFYINGKFDGSLNISSRSTQNLIIYPRMEEIRG